METSFKKKKKKKKTKTCWKRLDRTTLSTKKKKCWQKRSKTAKRRKNDRILQETTERAHKIIYPHSVIANFRTEVKRIRIGCESYPTLYLSDSHPLRLEVSVNPAWHRAASTPRKVVDQQAERVSAAYRAEPWRWPRHPGAVNSNVILSVSILPVSIPTLLVFSLRMRQSIWSLHFFCFPSYSFTVHGTGAPMSRYQYVTPFLPTLFSVLLRKPVRAFVFNKIFFLGSFLAWMQLVREVV